MKRIITLAFLFFLLCASTMVAQQNVGIGTTAPADLLHIKSGNLRVENTLPALRLYKGTVEHASFQVNGNNFLLSHYGSGMMSFRTGGVPRLVITNAGDIGVNTITPSALLHILDGNIQFEGNNRFMDLHTGNPHSIGWRFYKDNVFKGGMVYDSEYDMVRLTHNFNFPGLHYDLVNRYLGVGVMEPLEALHILDGGIRHESDNNFIDVVSTDSLYLNGIRFHQRSDFKGALFMNTLTNNLNITNSAVNSGLVLNFNTNNIGVHTDTPLDPLHISGQLRIEDGTPRLKFYNGSTYKAFLQHSNENLILSNFDPGFLYLRTDNLNRIAIDGTGNVGIGNNTPGARLDVLGLNNWDLGSTEGDFRIGNASYRIKMGVALDGGGAGTGRIYASGGTDRMVLGAGTTDVLAIEGEGEVGIGTNTPGYALDIQQPNARSLNIENAYTGASNKYGINVDVDGGGSGSKYGMYARAYGDNGSSYVYGLRSFASGSNNSGNVYGLYAQVNASGTGNHYGVYTYAPTADPSSNTRSFALYANGNSYFQYDVRIGTLDGAEGYLLSVDGKIMSEELKVQMSENWPDYVFQPEYQLASLSEVRSHIQEKGHLPGVPSASEVEKENGFHVGEMNRILLEKVEELTLYILQQDERIDELESRLTQLQSK